MILKTTSPRPQGRSAPTAIAALLLLATTGCRVPNYRAEDSGSSTSAPASPISTTTMLDEVREAPASYSPDELIRHARAFESGEIGPKSPGYAIKLYRAAVAHGSAEAACRLGTMLARNRGAEASHREARSLWEQSLVAGYTDAKYWLGTRLCTGCDGLEVDCERGWTFMLELAEADDPEAIFFVGDCLSKGICVSRDLSEARKWFLCGSALADPRCCRRAAEMLASGHGGPADRERAYQLNVASLHSSFVPRHEVELDAVKPYWIQAELDAARAELTGLGTIRSETSAIERLKRLASHREPEALMLLGDCLVEGNGVSRDRAKGYVMFALAVHARDNAEARNRIHEVGKQLTKDEVDLAAFHLSKLLDVEDMLAVTGKRR